MTKGPVHWTGPFDVVADVQSRLRAAVSVFRWSGGSADGMIEA